MEKTKIIRLHNVQGRRRFHVDDPRSTNTGRIKPDLKIFVAVPWLYGTIYPSCLEHIAALECPEVEIMDPYYVKPKNAWKASRDPKDISDKYGPSAANVNRYIRKFMTTDATHMLMVDADMEIPSHALDELLKLDVDIASGVSVGHATAQMSTVVKWFPKPRPKSHRSKPYWRFLQAGQAFGKMFYSPPERLRTGAFCMLTKRRVFEKHHPKLSPLKFRWNPPQRWGIDLTFWEDARRWGFTSAIHGGVIAGHLPEFPLKKLATMEWI